MPRTTSTDMWKTAANQTPRSGWAAGGKRDTINAGLAAARDAGKFDILLDTLAVMADPLDSGKWLTNGANYYTSSDGTHISPSGNALLAPHLRSALLSLTVDQNRPDYIAWKNTINWNGADSSPGADANDDGLKNFVAYALDISPVGNATPFLPSALIDQTSPDGPWLAFTYRENATAMDLQITVETSSDLVTWTTASSDGTTTILETADANPDGDGSAILRRLRIKKSGEETHRFARLKVRY